MRAYRPLYPASPSLAALVAVIASIVVLLAFYVMLAESLRGNDDTIWLYVTGQQLFARAKVAASYELARGFLLGQPDGEVALFRWNLRERYADNYLATSTLLYATGTMLKPLFLSVRGGYHAFLALALAVGFTLAVGVALVVMQLALLRCRDLRYPLAALVAIAAAAALTLVPTRTGYIAGLLEANGIVDGLLYALGVLVNPGPEYSMFGYTPRSQIALLTLPVFLLRWRAAYGAAYWLVAGLALVHQSMAGLLLLLLVAVDMVVRPFVFGRSVLFAVAVGAAAMLARESLFTTLGLWLPALAVVGGLGAIAAVRILVLRGRSAALRRFRRVAAAIALALRRLGRAGGDLAVLAAIWVATLPVAYVAAGGDALMRHHFWGEIHVRILALMQPALLGAFALGLASLALRHLRGRSRAFAAGATVVLSCALAAPIASKAFALAAAEPVLPRVAQQLAAYNQFLARRLPPLDLQVREAVLYYAIALSADTGVEIVPSMVRP